MVKTILVTGAKGQLGRSLYELSKKDTLNQWIFCSREELEITQKESIEKAFIKHLPSHCINCAAFTDVRLAEKEPEKARAINEYGVAKLMDACNRHNTTLIHLSTDYVFDGKKESPYTEEDTINPLNVYGKTKAAGEKVVLEEGIKSYVVRTAWLYAEKHGHNFYRSILAKARAGEKLEVVNDQTGTPTSTTELAHYLKRLIHQEPPFGVYHFAGTKIHTWFSFAKAILAEHNLETALNAIITPKDALKRPLYSPLVSLKPLNNEV